MTLCLLAFLFFLSLTPQSPAQVAITEVMSAPRSNSVTGFLGVEYWELTNFGTNDVDLDGYSFRDGVPTRSLVYYPFTNLVIRAGESIVFFCLADAKATVKNVAQFRAWWGDARLPANLQCRTWLTPRLSGWDGDAVALYNKARHLVDMVQFGVARQSSAFTYEPETGLFGMFSVPGENGAFTAALTDDVGSPGSTSGLVPLQFTQQPADQIVDAGMSVTFRATAIGLPRPQYQWFHKGILLPLATGPELILPNAQTASDGTYQAVVTNGLSTIVSINAQLTVSTNPSAPAILIAPSNLTVFAHQTAVFTVAARGLPSPGYQWQLEGVDIPGAVGPRLEFPDVNSTHSGRRFSVRVANPLGATNVSATLTVLPRPDLRFTEVMARPFDEEGNRHFDWFELTNYEPHPLNLTGWRFSDQPSFTRAVVITNPLVLNPGESVVFAERLNETLFANWWGRDNLPHGLKIQTYNGFGLGYLGEQVFLWNDTATNPYDYLATVSWATATLGVSFECERECPDEISCLDDAKIESTLGVRGAFRAAGGPDIGSPGYVSNPPLRILDAFRQPSGQLVVRSRVIPGRSYRLWRAPTMTASGWSLITTRAAFNNVLELADSLPPHEGAFYRVEEVP